MAKSPGRTDRKTEVLNAAAGLFVANGYMSTTMDDIATAVSLNKGTLYYYYDSKASILFDIVNRLEQGRIEAARAVGGDPDQERTLRDFIEESAVYILDNPISARIAAQESPFLDMWLSPEQLAALNKGHTEFQGHLLRYLKQSMGDDGSTDQDVIVAAQVITGALTWLTRWFSPKGPRSKEDVAAQIADVLVDGVNAGAHGAARSRARSESTKPRRSGGAAVNDSPKVARPERPQTRDKAQERRNRAAAVNRQLS